MLGLLGQHKSNAQPSLKNVVGVNALQSAYSAIGLGLYYERFVTPNAKLSLTLPVSVGWISENGYRPPMQYSESLPVYLVNPGVKIYPFGSKKFFSYAVGPSVFAHIGRTDYIFGNVTQPHYNKDEVLLFDYVTAGVCLNNYINFKVTRSWSFGLELGLGPSFYNRYTPTDGSMVIDGGTYVFQHASFQIAYRF